MLYVNFLNFINYERNLIRVDHDARKTKEAEVTKKMALELKIRKLTLSGNNASVEYILNKEYDYALLQAQIVKINEIIAEVQIRKAEL